MGAAEFFGSETRFLEPLSVPEDCSKESSSTKSFKINFSLPEKQFGFYFSGNLNNLSMHKKYLRSITIPNGVGEIIDHAFYGCSKLIKIYIPSSVLKIGSFAFYQCSAITNISIPNSVTQIGDYVFGDCSSLLGFSFPDSVIKIGENVFSGCYSLLEIIFPKFLKKIAQTILPFSFINKKAILYKVQLSNVIGSFNNKIVFGEKTHTHTHRAT